MVRINWLRIVVPALCGAIIGTVVTEVLMGMMAGWSAGIVAGLATLWFAVNLKRRGEV